MESWFIIFLKEGDKEFT